MGMGDDGTLMHSSMEKCPLFPDARSFFLPHCRSPRHLDLLLDAIAAHGNCTAQIPCGTEYCLRPELWMCAEMCADAAFVRAALAASAGSSQGAWWLDETVGRENAHFLNPVSPW